MKAYTHIKPNEKVVVSWPGATIKAIYNKITGYRLKKSSKNDNTNLWPELHLEEDQHASIESIEHII